MSDAAATLADTVTDAQVAKLMNAARGTRQSASVAQDDKPAAPARTAPNPARQARNDRFARAANAKPVITFETAARLCPTPDQIGHIVTSFGLEDVDYAHIREKTEEAIILMSRAIEPDLVVAGFDGQTNNKALEMHLQRIVGAFVGSAYGAANFYENKRNAARELSSQYNEAREEDRMGIDGLANRAGRAREFAASLAMKAWATLAAAEGALSAYEHMIGSPWKPYEGAQDNGARVSRDAAAAQNAALGF